MTLPEAVRRRLVQLAEGVEYPMEVDGSSAAVLMFHLRRPWNAFGFCLERWPQAAGGRFVGTGQHR